MSDEKGIPTAEELARDYKKANTSFRFAHSMDGSAVAVFLQGKWVCWLSRTIVASMPWVLVEGQMPLVNGEAPYTQQDWIEV